MDNEQVKEPEVVEAAPVAAAPAAPAAAAPRAERSYDNREPRDRGDRGDRNPMHGKRRKKVCAFCAEKIAYIDYKDTLKLRKNLSERAKILPRRVTGTCAKHQRQLTIAVKRARHIALIPYITD